MKTKILSIIVGIVAVMTLGACSLFPAAAPADNGQIPQRIMNVYGNSQVYLTPDVAYINIGVHSQADLVGDALKQNNAQSNGVASSLAELGVAGNDVQTSAFNVYPVQQFGPQGEVIKTQYAVDNTVYVTVRDLTKLGQMLDAVVQNGANTINGIQFDVLDKSKAMSEGRTKAIENARAQALEMANAAGVKLGPLTSLNVAVNGGAVPVFQGKGGARTDAAGPVPVSAGQLVLSVDANLSYEIK
jgi:uncharacterized protein YggE